MDPGTKRIGLALSDDMQWTARPFEVWPSKGTDADVAHVFEVVRANEVGEIVVGVPYRLDGTPSRSTEKALAFVAALRAAAPEGMPVTERDEALTTWAAEERLKERGMLPRDRRKLIDAFAAAVILQELLDERDGAS
ncbi:MAG: Holliday junction resolvase RuvX [Deltaproteobacteria bacterium]